MIRIFNTGEISPEQILKRDNAAAAADKADAAVQEIIKNVELYGDRAVLDYCERFDGVRPEALELPRKAMEEAACRLEQSQPEFMRILRRAKRNITEFHRRQVRRGFNIEDEGIVLGQRITPLQRVGVYVPGGTASYPSTVLMDCIPAKLAGVKEIVMTTPAKNGTVSDRILAAAFIAGVDRVFGVGGAQAIAALALGTQSIPRVDKIVGPGNIYVAAAKRRVYGMVDIDMIAGPSEILIISDSLSSPACVAADMLSQAEHDRNASAVLICDSGDFAQKVSREIECQIPLLERADICRASIDGNGMIIVAQDLLEAVSISNSIAPEHLEICTEQPFVLMQKVTNAGSIFLGRFAPEALGDYMAGPNHTLPTNGTARFSSPLSVDDFIKKSSYVWYNEKAFSGIYKDVAAFARTEGLTAHARSAESREELMKN